MAKKKIARIGIIGCGRIAREGHLPYLKRNPRVEIAAAMDLNEECRRKMCGRFGIKNQYDNPREMFEKEGLDGVLICTPNWVHRDLTLLAAEHGVNVFCEKPMARDAAECEEMVAACKKAGVKLQIGMVKRFDAGFVKMKKMIMAGKLGAVSQMSATSLSSAPRMDTPLYETAKKWASVFGMNIEEQMGLWRLSDDRTGGGHLFEMGTHLMDFILYLADEKPAEWSGFVNRKRPDMVWEDQGTIVVKFPSGLIATAEMNMSVTADSLFGEKGRVYGDKASLDYNYINGMWFGLPLYEYIPTQITMFHTLSPFMGIGLPVPVPVGKKIYMHKLQMDYFVDSILGRDTDYFGMGPDFASTGEDGLAVIKIIDDIYRADRKEKPKKGKKSNQ